MYRVMLSLQAIKDLKLLKACGLSEKARSLTDVLAHDPFQSPPPFEKLTGDLQGYYSRRINILHRMVYEVLDGERNASEILNEERSVKEDLDGGQIVKVLRMWSHYE
jgi:toxin YoeB